MNVLKALGIGLFGAAALTLLHETVRRVEPDAPRLDLLGMQAIAKTMRWAGATPPAGEALHHTALVGDLVSNALYYSLVGAGEEDGIWRRAVLLGLAAGIGAVVLPPLLGMDRQATQRTPATQAMTVGWYLTGGLAAAAAARLLEGR